MNTAVLTKTYNNLPFNKKEILRYGDCKDVTPEIEKLLNECIEEVKSKLSYKVCYCVLPVKAIEKSIDFDAFRVNSEKLSLNLKNCERVIVFGATLGTEIDRLIMKHGKLSPTKALFFQSIGAAQIEALCDEFLEDIKKDLKVNLKPRFSPGFGDLELTTQKDIFKVLDCSKKIGLTLNDSLLMSPTKSVTAFVGIIK
ncbi:MAG: Vitamin B12 dependent methionine synthase activation subunit [Clostridia bacterium]|nr:Vitamin B12 dependent methionine synthase activation subunit [Clostridia bacterium]